MNQRLGITPTCLRRSLSAEANAVADKERREQVEARNNAEALIHATEKIQLADNEDKIDAADKEAAEAAVGELKTALEGEDMDAINEKAQALSQAAMKIGEACIKRKPKRRPMMRRRTGRMAMTAMLSMPSLKKSPMTMLTHPTSQIRIVTKKPPSRQRYSAKRGAACPKPIIMTNCRLLVALAERLLPIGHKWFLWTCRLPWQRPLPVQRLCHYPYRLQMDASASSSATSSTGIAQIAVIAQNPANLSPPPTLAAARQLLDISHRNISAQGLRFFHRVHILAF